MEKKIVITGLGWGNHDDYASTKLISSDYIKSGTLVYGTADLKALEGMFGFDLTTSVKKPTLPKQAVSFTEKTKTKDSKMVDPVRPDINYPVKGYFNADKRTTVLVFADGSKIKVSSDTEGKDKTAYQGIIIALSRRILGTRTSVNGLYEKFKTDPKTEAMFYGVVMGYFVTSKIVRDAQMFDRWMIEFMATKVSTFKSLKTE